MLQYVALASLLGRALGQAAGDQQAENHPSMSWQRCSGNGNCQTVQGEVVIDSNWRWLHVVDGWENCYEGNEWNTEYCPNSAECSENCVYEGADYQATYGASASGNSLRLQFVTEHQYGTNIGSRLYLMESTDRYQMFTLMNNELAFDVELSELDCGLNGALYFVKMEADGGAGSYGASAGAEYGVGYCDAQCARDLKFVGGKANNEGWEPSSNDENAGVGPMGGCCAEMDVWESNARAMAFTPHPCQDIEYHVCETSGCGGTYSENRFGGDCDPNGCDFNPYRMGVTDFYGSGMTVDTDQKITVVTQFEENEITQFFVQNGRKIEMPGATWDGVEGMNTITPEFCRAQFQAFDDRDRFNEVGGFGRFNEAMRGEWVLVMSLWDDHYANMLWLDSSYPPEKAGQPGGDRGPCPQSSGVPADVESSLGSATVTYSNIRFGPIGSTVNV